MAWFIYAWVLEPEMLLLACGTEFYCWHVLQHITVRSFPRPVPWCSDQVRKRFNILGYICHGVLHYVFFLLLLPTCPLLSSLCSVMTDVPKAASFCKPSLSGVTSYLFLLSSPLHQCVKLERYHCICCTCQWTSSELNIYRYYMYSCALFLDILV